MAGEKAVFVGPRLRRLRRDLGLTQTVMAEDLGISPSYIALIERNQRPLTAKVLLKLAQIYKVDLSQFAGDGGTGVSRRLEDLLKDPLFSDLDLAPGEVSDLATGHPGLAEALVRTYRAYRDGQMALADHAGAEATADPLEETRAFLATHRNFFADLDHAAELIGRDHDDINSLIERVKSRHGFRTRRMPRDIMAGAVRRFEYHRRELLLDESLDAAATAFQIALQLVYLELGDAIDAIMKAAHFKTEDARRMTRRALAGYGAGAILMPYTSFYREAEARRYDIEALSRRFRVSFEQVAHRLTSLQKPGQEGVPFFFIRVDPAGNVSKRFDGSDYPFARQGGSCPLWSLHATFQTPGRILTQIVELPDGAQFFSVSRTVTAGGGAYGAPRAERAVALGCSIEDAARLVYSDGMDIEDPDATPIGIACRLCQRTNCVARAEPPLGRQLLGDENRRMAAPFLFGDEG
ncbi:short-chain fatty acyl-CoA regulator family protein [Henriciella sp.]|uniref:helix-turn-helix domain-containing protein n=1 Tax=Henriciella sp. TaxID=1968823 RepID=UPI0026315ECC|nr:short-chain fatty acyl-CoA regulator family protein [Henriciella sp.]